MHVISRKRLREFWDIHPSAEAPLVEWYRHMEKANYPTPHDLKTHIPKVSILKCGRVVFNIGGNKYRLVVSIDYERQIVLVRFVGTHGEYDKIDAETV